MQPSTRTAIRLIPARPEDAGPLTVIQALCFFDDRRQMPREILKRTPSLEGPPGCRSVEWNRKVIEHKSSAVYKALDRNRNVGGLILLDRGGRTWEVGRIYVDPDHQNRGIDQEMIRKMFARHPQVVRWRLGTPEWAVRNQQFYERMGFTLLTVTDIDPNLGWRSVEYENTLSAEERSLLQQAIEKEYVRPSAWDALHPAHPLHARRGALLVLEMLPRLMPPKAPSRQISHPSQESATLKTDARHGILKEQGSVPTGAKHAHHRSDVDAFREEPLVSRRHSRSAHRSHRHGSSNRAAVEPQQVRPPLQYAH